MFDFAKHAAITKYSEIELDACMQLKKLAIIKSKYKRCFIYFSINL